MRVTANRCRHALRAITPALDRLGIDVDVEADDPLATAHRVSRAVLSGATPAKRRTLQLTAILVSLVHDEYMFIRALQSYETVFAAIGVQLTAGIAALTRGDAARATEAIGEAEASLREGGPLWSLVATMQAEAFLRFREYTDGASAIQSRNYKRLRSLCRRPDRDRLDPRAYRSVPEIRERVVAGQPTIDEALGAAIEAGLLTLDEHTALSARDGLLRDRDPQVAKDAASRCGCSESAAGRATPRAWPTSSRRAASRSSPAGARSRTARRSRTPGAGSSARQQPQLRGDATGEPEGRSESLCQK